MTGPKTNEGATAVGERTGTRCVVRYVRSSASKARVVLDQIRGLDVQRADEVLQFTEREIARVIRKALASAVANAENNDGQTRDELYVSACFADEGPTLKRWRPRARGRATRIRKRTCHITVIVSRMTDEMLETRRRREEARPQAGRARRSAAATAAARRERVARSRRAAAEATAAEAVPETVEETAGTVEDTAVEETSVEETSVEETGVEETGVAETAETVEETEAAAGDVSDEATEEGKGA